MGQRLSDFLRRTDPLPILEPGVYLIRRFRDDCCKIGCAHDLGPRIARIIAECSGEAELLHTIRVERFREAEAYFHKLFRAAHIGREWHRLNDEDIRRLRTFRTWPREG